MLNYATVGSNKLTEARRFYDELLATIGWGGIFEHPSGGRLYGKPGSSWFGPKPRRSRRRSTTMSASSAR